MEAYEKRLIGVLTLLAIIVGLNAAIVLSGAGELLYARLPVPF